MSVEGKRMVVVEWLDAVALAQWCAANNLQEPMNAKTIGWVIHDDETYIQVAATIATDGEYNQSMTIPKGMVASIKDVG